MVIFFIDDTSEVQQRKFEAQTILNPIITISEKTNSTPGACSSTNTISELKLILPISQATNSITGESCMFLIYLY